MRSSLTKIFDESVSFGNNISYEHFVEKYYVNCAQMTADGICNWILVQM